MNQHIRHIAVTLALGAAALTACSSTADDGTDTSSKPAASNAAKTDDKPAQKKPSADKPEDDVKVTSCGKDDFGVYPQAKVQIVNSQDKDQNYMVQVEFVDGSGTRVAEGAAAANNVAPGQKVVETAAGLAKASGGVECKVTKVTRYASL